VGLLLLAVSFYPNQVRPQTVIGGERQGATLVSASTANIDLESSSTLRDFRLNDEQQKQCFAEIVFSGDRVRETY
jgi:hypothetical protein